MTLQPFTIETFGSLDITTDPFELGANGATNASNVDYDRPGRVRSRYGNTLVKNVGSVNAISGLAAFETSSGSLSQLIVKYQTTVPANVLAAYNSTGGAAVASAVPGAGNTPLSAVRWGDPTNERLYIADTTGTWRWTGAAFSQPGGTLPDSDFLAVTPRSNRLAVAVNSSPSRVAFSGAGTPETFGANDFVTLTPGDGSRITGLVSVQDKVVAFKRDRMFVFTGESVDGTGSPVFDYFPIERYGALVPPAVGDEGVYFFDGRVVWLWNGAGMPTRISAPIEPFLDGTGTINGGTGDYAVIFATQMWYSNGRLWMSVPSSLSSTVRATLVYHARTQTWTSYSMPVGGVATLRATSKQPITYWQTGDIAAAMAIYRVDPTVSTDDGTAIAWSHQTGKYPLANPGLVAVTDVQSLVGTGTVTLAIDSDLYPTQTASATLGTAPTPAEGWPQPLDQEGTWLQTTLSGSGPASVSRLNHYVSSVKPSGVR